MTEARRRALEKAEEDAKREARRLRAKAAQEAMRQSESALLAELGRSTSNPRRLLRVLQHGGVAGSRLTLERLQLGSRLPTKAPRRTVPSETPQTALPVRSGAALPGAPGSPVRLGLSAEVDFGGFGSGSGLGGVRRGRADGVAWEASRGAGVLWGKRLEAAMEDVLSARGEREAQDLRRLLQQG